MIITFAANTAAKMSHSRRNYPGMPQLLFRLLPQPRFFTVLYNRLIELGKPFDYMAYPNRDHGIRKGRGTSVHLRMLIARYLTDHLPPGPR
jgi:hypothetical protein